MSEQDSKNIMKTIYAKMAEKFVLRVLDGHDNHEYAEGYSAGVQDFTSILSDITKSLIEEQQSSDQATPSKEDTEQIVADFFRRIS